MQQRIAVATSSTAILYIYIYMTSKCFSRVGLVSNLGCSFWIVFFFFFFFF